MLDAKVSNGSYAYRVKKNRWGKCEGQQQEKCDLLTFDFTQYEV